MKSSTDPLPSETDKIITFLNVFSRNGHKGKGQM